MAPPEVCYYILCCYCQPTSCSQDPQVYWVSLLETHSSQIVKTRGDSWIKEWLSHSHIPDTLTKVQIVKGVTGNYLPNELIPNNFIVYASFKKDMIPNTILPLPSFKEIEDVNIILNNETLQLQIHHLLENDEL